MSKIWQYKLESDDKRLTTWLNSRVKVGDSVSLKDSEEPERWWKVVEVMDESETNKINRKWGQTDYMGNVPKAGE